MADTSLLKIRHNSEIAVRRVVLTAVEFTRYSRPPRRVTSTVWLISVKGTE